MGLKPFYPGASQGEPEAVAPWKLTDKFLPNREDFPQFIVREEDLCTLRDALTSSVHRKLKVNASLKDLHRKPQDTVFTAPMVVYSKGFTKSAYCDYPEGVKFFDGLRSITGKKKDANLLRFLSVVIGSRLFKYVTFHSGSNSGIGRDQIHVYESLPSEITKPSRLRVRTNAASSVAASEAPAKYVQEMAQKKPPSLQSDREATRRRR